MIELHDVVYQDEDGLLSVDSQTGEPYGVVLSTQPASQLQGGTIGSVCDVATVDGTVVSHFITEVNEPRRHCRLTKRRNGSPLVWEIMLVHRDDPGVPQLTRGMKDLEHLGYNPEARVKRWPRTNQFGREINDQQNNWYVVYRWYYTSSTGDKNAKSGFVMRHTYAEALAEYERRSTRKIIGKGYRAIIRRTMANDIPLDWDRPMTGASGPAPAHPRRTKGHLAPTAQREFVQAVIAARLRRSSATRRTSNLESILSDVVRQATSRRSPVHGRTRPFQRVTNTTTNERDRIRQEQKQADETRRKSEEAKSQQEELMKDAGLIERRRKVTRKKK